MDDDRTDRRRVYPAEPWRIREIGFDPRLAARNETIFALANGHLGIRGTLEEPSGNAIPGVYVNGFYERHPITYGERAHGYARYYQVLLSVADGTRIGLTVDDEPLDLATGTVMAHERVLDLRAGTLVRRLRWRSPAGSVVEVESTRLVSLVRPAIAAIEYRARLVEGGARLGLESAIEIRPSSHGPGSDPRIGSTLPEGALGVVHAEASPGWAGVVQRTRASDLTLAVAMCHDLAATGAGGEPVVSSEVMGERPTWRAEAPAVPGTEVRLVKTLAYHQPPAGATPVEPAELLAAAAADAAAARDAGFGTLLAEQRRELDAFWAIADVQIDGDESVQQGVRYNLFSMLQGAGRDGRRSLPAKGLTGEGYHGHYFWDTEIFALPFFLYTSPSIARALLRYRCATLDQARERAAEMHQRGALFPWRTINGEEASAYFPAGTAQYHIDADIAYAFARYLDATGDDSLLEEGGAQVVVETARLWADLGAYIPAQGGAFCINGVTGPDEYTALVNNNAFTNLMARRNLRFAADLVERLARERPGLHARVVAAVGLTAAEVAEWRRAADGMRVPHDDALGITAQDDAFLQLERWDFEGTPRSMYPLLLHVHPLVIYRHQVLKQPDVVLAQVLLSSEFTLPEKRRNFDYYDPLTTGDSSLSPSIQSVAAAELGHGDLAYRYFMATARMDLDDVNGNVEHGVHIAAMAGSWVAVVFGFGGFRDDDGELAFAPRLPAAWTGLRFRLRVREAVLEVTMRRGEVAYGLIEGERLAIRHFGRPVEVLAGAPVVLGLAPARDALGGASFPPPGFEAVIFDMDGVVTQTALVHAAAWKRLFDDYLRERAARTGEPFREFDTRAEYRAYVDGMPRYDGVRRFLASRGITLPEGTPDDPPEAETVCGLGNRKNGYFLDRVREEGVRAFPTTVTLIGRLRERGIGTAIISASENATMILEAAGVIGLFDAQVDGTDSARLGLTGKPDPAIFVEAARRLGVDPSRAVVVEDALAGVEAARSGGFGLVVGIDRVGLGSAMADRGADIVVGDLGELLVAEGR